MNEDDKSGMPAPASNDSAGMADAGSDYDRVHLRLPRRDAEALRKLARGRDQTLSATVRFLLRHYLRGK